MRFVTEPGKKALKDKIIKSKCPHCRFEERLLLTDLAKWIRAKGKIERICYPNGKGEKLLLEFFHKCLTMNPEGNYIYTIEECCQLFGLEVRQGAYIDCEDIPLT